MSECVYKRQDGTCERLSDDEVREYCVEGPCPLFSPEGGTCEFVDSGFLDTLFCSACGEAVGTKAETQRMRFCPYCGKRRIRNEN